MLEAPVDELAHRLHRTWIICKQSTSALVVTSVVLGQSISENKFDCENHVHRSDTYSAIHNNILPTEGTGENRSGIAELAV